MFPRSIWVLLVTVLGPFITGCGHPTDAQVVGAWKFEDAEEVQELVFNDDHSLRWYQDVKGVLSTPGISEARGTWRIERNRIEGKVTFRFSEMRQTVTAEFTADGALLVVNDSDKNPVTFHRFQLPKCPDSRVLENGQQLQEIDLSGLWKMHFNTHDYQVRLGPERQFAMVGFYLDEWHPISEGEWRLEEQRLIAHSKWAEAGPEKYVDRTWIITAAGKDCLLAEDADGCQFALERLPEREISAPPSGAFLSKLASPHPTETPSPRR
jgi:hypothetical protein